MVLENMFLANYSNYWKTFFVVSSSSAGEVSGLPTVSLELGSYCIDKTANARTGCAEQTESAG